MILKYNLVKNTFYITGPNMLHKQTPDTKNPMHEICIYLKIPNSKNTDRVAKSSSVTLLQSSSRSWSSIHERLSFKSPSDSELAELVSSGKYKRVISTISLIVREERILSFRILMSFNINLMLDYIYNWC